jgi:hypothetical protein
MMADDSEGEKRQTTEGRYSTIIFLPHARAKFRKLKVSHRLLFTLVSLIASSLTLSVFFSVLFFQNLERHLSTRNLSTAALERELAEANAQMLRAHKNLQVLTQQMIEEQRNRERQLRDIEKRYETLRVLAEGQEKIAEAHRLILQQRSASQRIVELGLGFSIGVLSSLVGAVVWAWIRSKPLSAAEAEKLDFD